MQLEYVMNKQKWENFSDYYQQVFEDIQDGPTIQLLKLLHFIRSHVEQSEMELGGLMHDVNNYQYLDTLQDNADKYKWKIDGDSLLLYYLAIQIRSKIDNPFGFPSEEFEKNYGTRNIDDENPDNGIHIMGLNWLTKEETILVQRFA